MNTIKSIIQNSDGLGFAIATMTLIYTIYSSRTTSSRHFIEQRHKQLISPVFFLLEPYLFKSINNNVLDKVFDLINQNKYLADGKLLEVTYFCIEYPSQGNYNNLCSYIDKAYDKSCKQLGLKLRPIEYRVNRIQYKSKASLLFYLIIFGFKAVLIFITLFFLTLTIFGLAIHWFENTSSPENQIRVLFFVWIPIYILFRKLESKY